METPYKSCNGQFRSRTRYIPGEHRPSHGCRTRDAPRLRSYYLWTIVLAGEELPNALLDCYPFLRQAMANLLRTPKSSNEWSSIELLAFHIRVQDVDAPAFFNTKNLPPPLVSATILNNFHKPAGQLTKDERYFFDLMGLAGKFDNSAIDDFAAFILRFLDYDDGDRMVRQKQESPLIMAGDRMDAQSDICVMNKTDILLLAREEKVSLYYIIVVPAYTQPITAALNRYRRGTSTCRRGRSRFQPH